MTYTQKLKVKLYQYTIIYAKNCTISFKDTTQTEELVIKKGEIALLEKNLDFIVNIDYCNNAEPFVKIKLSDECLEKITQVFECFNSLSASKTDLRRGLNDKIFVIPSEGLTEALFQHLSSIQGVNDNIYDIVCLLSKVSNMKKFYASLCVSVSRSFTDIVRKEIDNDISKKWTLKELAERLNISEIAIRKKLEAENTSFNQILLDARMHRAARLILECNIHVNTVSDTIGISSASYFIKLFSSYFGVTPKQFYFQYKSSSGSTLKNIYHI